MLLARTFIPTILIAFCIQTPIDAQEQIARPVDSNRSFDRSVFHADYDRVWGLMLKILSGRGFQFLVKDKNLGRFETDYIIFSRHPQLSKLNDGVKSLGRTPRIFFRKWVDGRIRVFAEVHRVAQDRTDVVLRPDIYGFASFFTDDSSVSGEWRQCTSNGKFELELFNELATTLRKEGSTNPPEVTVVKPPAGKAAASCNLVLSSVPEEAEILLNDRFVGMTPSRLSVPPGNHRLVFRKKGYKDYKREFLAFGNSDLTIAVELESN